MSSVGRGQRASLLLTSLLLLAACAGTGSRPPRQPRGPDSDALDEARLSAWQGDPQAAFDDFRALYRRKPRQVAAWWGALAAATSDEQVQLIKADLATAWTRLDQPELVALRTLRAHFDVDVGRREETLLALAEESRDSPMRGWPYLGLGHLFYERGSLDAAVDAFRKAVNGTPTLTDARSARARALLDLGRYREAIPDLESYLQDRPRDPTALYNLAWILLNVRGAPRDARPYLERAYAVTPKDLAVLMALGTAALRSKPPDVKLARDCYTAAREVAPTDPDVHLNLGVLYADHLDNPRAAAAEFKRYIDLGGRQADRAKRWVAELEKR